MPLGLCMLVSITACTSENTFSQTSENSVMAKFAEGQFAEISLPNNLHHQGPLYALLSASRRGAGLRPLPLLLDHLR
jgi:hypothetical protein